jgi:hypothetical protein
MDMSGKIVSFLRELVAPLSILLIIGGIILMCIGIVWYWVRSLADSTSSPLHFIINFGEWNAYVLVGGFILFGVGLYYFYSYMKKRHFLLKEMKTNKRSELLKKDSELKVTVKRLPKKYQKMLRDKEDELHID